MTLKGHYSIFDVGTEACLGLHQLCYYENS